MRILFISTEGENYLADSILLGLRELYGVNCVDYPKAEHLYAGFKAHPDYPLYGNGFTLYSGLLPDIEVDRHRILAKVKKGFFDWVIFGEIWQQHGLFAQWRPFLDPKKTVILDGQDTPQVHPYAGLWWRYPSRWFLPRAHKEFLYCKREWTPDSQFNLWHRLVPASLRKYLSAHKNLRPISFSIPESKIIKSIPEKKKDFAAHCVDPEVAERIPGCKTSYAFQDEAEYYADLQASRFAITTKRAGWDCLRHYEIAANGCVPCFRDLDRKPSTCAPHGLQDEVNCISYHSPRNLFERIGSLADERIETIQKNALAWAHSNSSTKIAERLVLDASGRSSSRVPA